MEGLLKRRAGRREREREGWGTGSKFWVKPLSFHFWKRIQARRTKASPRPGLGVQLFPVSHIATCCTGKRSSEGWKREHPAHNKAPAFSPVLLLLRSNLTRSPNTDHNTFGGRDWKGKQSKEAAGKGASAFAKTLAPSRSNKSQPPIASPKAAKHTRESRCPHSSPK